MDYFLRFRDSRLNLLFHLPDFLGSLFVESQLPLRLFRMPRAAISGA